METLLIRGSHGRRPARDFAGAAPADLTPADGARAPATVVLGSRRPARRSPLRDPTLATLATEDVFGRTPPAGGRGEV